MWIWDLEAGWAVPVAIPVDDSSDIPKREVDGMRSGSAMPTAASTIVPTVAFDERRIVSSMGTGGYYIWRFDL
jgi:hypothetical protein